jgi:V/A-type H+/Na+-transporting ATPase subunit I
MHVPMAKVRIVGHRRRLDRILETLHGWKGVQLIDVGQDSGVRLPPLAVDDEQLHEIEELRYLRTRLDALLRLLPSTPVATSGGELDVARLRADLDEAGSDVERIVGNLDDLRRQQDSLPRHLESLRRLLPLVPDLADLEGYDTTALLLDARHTAVLGELNARLTAELGGNFEIISDRLDRQTIGAVLIYPKAASERVQREFGREQVSRVRLPERFEGMAFSDALAAMQRRLAELPGEIELAEDAVSDFVRAHPDWPAERDAIAARLDQLAAVRSLGATPHTFVLSGWVPVAELPALRSRLSEGVGDEVVVDEVPTLPGERPPVLLHNTRPARPFESLVRLLDLPRYGSLDPTTMMLVFFPLFFGMMLGDVVYGALVACMALVAVRRLTTRGFAHDLSRILVLCGAWSVVWGVVYGEYLGDLGFRLFGVEPLWLDREQAIGPLLLFAIAVGAVHITLGLVLGIWQSATDRDRRKLGERVGLLVALGGLFAIAAVAADLLPEGMMTPAVAAAVVGLVLLIAAGGVMGLLTGPLELMGAVGNVLSYLRIAAIGIASVYLARVANELGAAAPLLLGILVATLFHAINLVLGVFSPTIQALRLHYVEFFDKFYEGGGESFRPFGGHSTPSGQSNHRT